MLLDLVYSYTFKILFLSGQNRKWRNLSISKSSDMIYINLYMYDEESVKVKGQSA